MILYYLFLDIIKQSIFTAVHSRIQSYYLLYASVRPHYKVFQSHLIRQIRQASRHHVLERPFTDVFHSINLLSI